MYVIHHLEPKVMVDDFTLKILDFEDSSDCELGSILIKIGSDNACLIDYPA